MPSARFNQGKPMLSFILQFPTAVQAFARVKEIGAIKYERDNWKKGGKPDHEYLDAALRHITAYMEGETFAEDTGCTHLAHATWNLMALQELNNKGVTHDPELFKQMCSYWQQKKEPPVEEDGLEFSPAPDAKVQGYEGEPQSLQRLEVPQIDKIFEFEKPLTINNGQSLHIDIEAKVAAVEDSDGNVVDEAAVTEVINVEDIFKCETPFGIPQNPLGPAQPAKNAEAEEALLRKIFGRE